MGILDGIVSWIAEQVMNILNMISNSVKNENIVITKLISKEMGYTALRTGLATLNSPYSNEYINDKDLSEYDYFLK